MHGLGVLVNDLVTAVVQPLEKLPEPDVVGCKGSTEWTASARADTISADLSEYCIEQSCSTCLQYQLLTVGGLSLAGNFAHTWETSRHRRAALLWQQDTICLCNLLLTCSDQRPRSRIVPLALGMHCTSCSWVLTICGSLASLDRYSTPLTQGLRPWPPGGMPWLSWLLLLGAWAGLTRWDALPFRCNSGPLAPGRPGPGP